MMCCETSLVEFRPAAGPKAASLFAFGHQLEQIAEWVGHERAAPVNRRLVGDLDAVLKEAAAPA